MPGRINVSETVAGYNRLKPDFRAILKGAPQTRPSSPSAVTFSLASQVSRGRKRRKASPAKPSASVIQVAGSGAPTIRNGCDEPGAA